MTLSKLLSGLLVCGLSVALAGCEEDKSEAGMSNGPDASLASGTSEGEKSSCPFSKGEAKTASGTEEKQCPLSAKTASATGEGKCTKSAKTASGEAGGKCCASEKAKTASATGEKECSKSSAKTASATGEQKSGECPKSKCSKSSDKVASTATQPAAESGESVAQK